MSFRQFIYYCSVCGGCAAYVGWIMGRLAGFDNSVLLAASRGMFLGMCVASVLTQIDAVWSARLRQSFQSILRMATAVLVGGLGGFLGGGIGQALYGWLQFGAFLFLGWTITGLLIGASISAFDMLARKMHDEELGGVRRKLFNGVLGGAAGGFLGGVSFLLLQSIWRGVLRGEYEDFWSPSATGFVILGVCIGLLIGLAQVILKEAWVRVEVGFRAGRELILLLPETTIGRAEGCHIALFGDSGVEKVHARILHQARTFILEDTGSASGTFINGKRITGPTPLASGDQIRLGSSILRFSERQKRGVDAAKAPIANAAVGMGSDSRVSHLLPEHGETAPAQRVRQFSVA
jgi:hypothetical protein